jgi:hypothetical protein
VLEKYFYVPYSREEHAASLYYSARKLEVENLKPGKHVSVEDNISLQNIFGLLNKDIDIVVQSCYCSQAILNENTGIYGCRLLERECPYDTPDPQSCLNSGRFGLQAKAKMYPLNKTIRSLRRKYGK